MPNEMALRSAPEASKLFLCTRVIVAMLCACFRRTSRSLETGQVTLTCETAAFHHDRIEIL